MKINEIFMQNFKDQNCSQELTGMDIFVGTNGAGKSSRIEALGIAIAGYCPGNGKNPGETFKMASDSQMSVGVKTDIFEVIRTFDKTIKEKRDGSIEVSVSQDVKLCPELRGETSLKAKEERIQDELGNLPVLLNFDEFLSQTDSKRRDFIYSLSPITESSWTRDRVEEHLKKALLPKGKEHTDPTEYEVVTELIAGAMTHFKGVAVSTGIQKAYAWAKEKQTYWNAEKKNAAGAVKKLSDLKNELEETDRNLGQNKIEIENLQTLLTNLVADMARNEEKVKAVRKRTADIAALQASIAGLHTAIAGPWTTGLDKAIKGLEDKLAASGEITGLEELQQKNTELMAQIDETEKKKDDLFKEGTASRLQSNTLLERCKTVRSQQGLCIIDCKIPCRQDFSSYLQETEKEQKELEQKIFEQIGLYRKTDAKLKDLRVKLKDNNDAQALYNQKISEQNKSNAALQQDLNALNQKRMDESSKLLQLKEQLGTKETELFKLIQEPEEDIAGVEEQEKQRAELEVKLAALKSKVAEQEKARTTLINLRSSMIDGKKAGFYLDGSKGLAKALGPSGLQGELVKEILDPIRSDIQSNLALMGIFYRFYFQTESETGKEVFEFGWKKGKKYINFDVLSTGEKVLLLIAIIVALLDRADPPCKVLVLDEIQRLYKGNLTMVIDGLTKLSDKLDNIILCGAIDPIVVEGWKVWKLSVENPTEERSVA